MSDEAELRWFLAREPLIQKLRDALAGYEVSAVFGGYRERGAAALQSAKRALAEFDKSSPRSVKAGKRPTRPASRVRAPKSKGGDSARREETTAADVFGAGAVMTQLVGANAPIAAVSPDLYPCRVCGKACVRLPAEDVDALGLNDGSGTWSVVHIACAREVAKR